MGVGVFKLVTSFVFLGYLHYYTTIAFLVKRFSFLKKYLKQKNQKSCGQNTKNLNKRYKYTLLLFGSQKLIKGVKKNLIFIPAALAPLNCLCWLQMWEGHCCCQLPPGPCWCQLLSGACWCQLLSGLCWCQLLSGLCWCQVPPGPCWCQVLPGPCWCHWLWQALVQVHQNP